MRQAIRAITTVVAIVVAAQGCRAAALTVSPISIQLVAPAQNATLTLQNRDNRPVYAQVRVFRWRQDHGEDLLEPSSTIMPSPPIVQVAGKGSYVLRLLRVSAEPVRGEEAYRVVVDELPDLNRQRNGAVNVLLRYVIPLFVGDADASQPQLHWRMGTDGSARSLQVENTGDRHVQIKSLSLKIGQRSLSVASGLAGYALGHSTRTWTMPGTGELPGSMRVMAGSDDGPINAALAP